MSKLIHIVKKLYIENGNYDSLNIKAFAKEEDAFKYVEKELEICKEEDSNNKNLDIWEEGINSEIYNYYGRDTIKFEHEPMMIDDEVEIPNQIYVYTEVNTYDSGEICSHAIGHLTEEGAKEEFLSEINSRGDEESENHYWISDGEIEDACVELEDENYNISYLQYEVVDVQK